MDFSPEDETDDIKKMFTHNQLELRLKNDKWETYKLDIAKEFIFRFIFFDNHIKLIEIYPKNSNEFDNIELLNLLKISILGEK